MSHGYHHPGLRDELLHRAAEVILDAGISEVSLRALARDAGVSHAAPRYHFSSRSGLLTALAAEGFGMLAERLRTAGESGDFLDVGVAYVAFATDHPAHFEVMFGRELLDDHAELVARRAEVFGILRSGVDSLAERGALDDAAAAVVAAWSLVHGLATLANTGNLDGANLRSLLPESDLLDVTRRAASMLSGSPGSGADHA